jgi:hypothetical protein
MGWSFRRSIRLGPLRLNLSKSGIGVSAGIPGLHVGKDAKGRSYSQVSLPGTGIYRRDYYKSNQNTTLLSGPTAPHPNQNPLPNPAAPTANYQRPMSQGIKYLIFLSTLAAVLWIVLRFVLK